MQPTLPGMEETLTVTTSGTEMALDPKTVPSAERPRRPDGGRHRAPVTPVDNTPARGIVGASDAPLCMQCGVAMVRAGSLLRLPQLRQHQRLQLTAERSADLVTLRSRYRDGG